MVARSSRQQATQRYVRGRAILFALAVLLGLPVQDLQSQSPGPPAPTLPAINPGSQPQPGPLGPPSSGQPQAPDSPPPLPPANLPPPQPGPTLRPLVIDPKTPTKDLLPSAPKVKKTAGPVLGDDLGQVPEVEFEAPLKKDLPKGRTLQHVADHIARINYLNAKKTDRFMEALRDERDDLSGLPMAMGDKCRTRGERNKQFHLAVNTVRRALAQGPGIVPAQPVTPAFRSTTGPGPGFAFAEQSVVQSVVVAFQNPGALGATVSADAFWDQYQALCSQEDRAQTSTERILRENVTQARIAAQMQMLAPTSASMRLGLVKHLATISHVDATRAIAKLAIFSAEEEIRQAAVEALKVRREKDYTDVLLQGLRYPWPAVARRASEVLVKLERNDVIPQLLDVLEEPDPRAPVMKKDTAVVRELVRINHHRNCLLCHAPGNTGNVPAETLTAGVPLPDEPLSPPQLGYQNAVPDILVRLDVTYLRQDFSLLQPVEDANPWPEMQRFDFLVRTRTLSEEEAKTWSDKLNKREPGQLSPYRRAVLTALRELTGKDTEPTPEAWRKLLGQMDKETRTPH